MMDMVWAFMMGSCASLGWALTGWLTRRVLSMVLAYGFVVHRRKPIITGPIVPFLQRVQKEENARMSRCLDLLERFDQLKNPRTAYWGG